MQISAYLLDMNRQQFPRHNDPKTGTTVFEVEKDKEGFVEVHILPPPVKEKTFYGAEVCVDGKPVKNLLVESGQLRRFVVGAPGGNGMVSMKFCTQHSGDAPVVASTHAKEDDGLPQYGGRITVAVWRVDVTDPIHLPRTNVLRTDWTPQVKLDVCDKKTDGMHVESGSTPLQSNPSARAIKRWHQPKICEFVVSYASEFVLVVNKVKLIKDEPRRTDTDRRAGGIVAERKRRRMVEDLQRAGSRPDCSIDLESM